MMESSMVVCLSIPGGSIIRILSAGSQHCPLPPPPPNSASCGVEEGFSYKRSSLLNIRCLAKSVQPHCKSPILMPYQAAARSLQAHTMFFPEGDFSELLHHLKHHGTFLLGE